MRQPRARAPWSVVLFDFRSTSLMRTAAVAVACACALALAASDAQAKQQRHKPRAAPAKRVVVDGHAEARLIEIYKLIAQAKSREALKEKMPDYYKYLVGVFGFDPDPAPASGPVASLK